MATRRGFLKTTGAAVVAATVGESLRSAAAAGGVLKLYTAT